MFQKVSFTKGAKAQFQDEQVIDVIDLEDTEGRMENVLMGASATGTSEQQFDHANIHLLPCKIGYTGKCNVSMYLPSLNDTCLIYFHGRALHCEKPLEGFQFLVLEKDKGLRIKKASDHIKVWERDGTKQNSKSIEKVIQWLDMAEVLHEET